VTYVFAIVGAVVFFGLVFLYFRRRWKREERIDSFKGKVALCQVIVEVTTTPNVDRGMVKGPDEIETVRCGVNLAEAGVFKRDRPIRGGSEFDCAGCGTKSIWDMDRTNPVLLAIDEPRKPRRPRRQR
jgi:hypothetical protein